VRRQATVGLGEHALRPDGNGTPDVKSGLGPDSEAAAW
jgi:hypothetical protein